MGLRQNERNPNGLLRAIGTKGYPLSMCAGAGLSVKKGQRMIVRTEWTNYIRQAGWHRRFISCPGNNYIIVGRAFLYSVPKNEKGDMNYVKRKNSVQNLS